MEWLHLVVLFAGLWALINGILHDVFVIRQHRGKAYDRELLRLLLDGHILISTGILQIAASLWMNTEAYQLAFFVSAFCCLILLVYCALIYPFLRSIGTISINVILLILLAVDYLK